MTIEDLRSLYNRDLARLNTEISSYTNEEMLWQLRPGIANSGGNLCLHLVGSLMGTIGVGLAKSDYIRQRDLEFSQKGVPKTTLLAQIDETIAAVNNGLDDLSDADLVREFPTLVAGKTVGMAYALLHLYGHLNYHLGQINYHRRIVNA